MQIWPGCTFGKSGRARAPERFVKSDGIQTLVMKLRLVQSLPGRSLTRFDFLTPPEEVWRTILRFLENGLGTVGERYKLAEANQKDSRHGADYQFRSQFPIGSRQRRRQTDEGSVAPLRTRTGIALVIQTLEALKQRIVAEECIWPVALDEFSLRRACREVVDENGARFPGPHQIERKFERAKIFRAIDQNGVARLQSFPQNFARIAVEQFDIREWLQFRFRSGGVL